MNPRFLEIYMKTIWKIQRVFLKKRLAKRCSKCVISEAYPKADIKDGLCTFCRGKDEEIATSEDTIQQAKSEMDGLLKETRGSGQYDCLVLYSGGKDSSYLLYFLKQEYNLRLLAVTVDNHFANLNAIENAKQVTDKLEIDHIVIKPHFKLYQKIYKYTFTHSHLKEGGCYHTVCAWCGAMTASIGFNLAADLNIPIVVSGLSPAQVVEIAGVNWFENKDNRLKSLMPEEMNNDFFTGEDKAYFWNPQRYPMDRRPRVIYPFFALRYKEQEIQRKVVELGLIKKGKESPLITNCQLIPLMTTIDIALMGYTAFEIEFSKLIREGKSNRGFWLAIAQILEYQVKKGKFTKDLKELLKKIELTPKEIGLSK